MRTLVRIASIVAPVQVVAMVAHALGVVLSCCVLALGDLSFGATTLSLVGGLLWLRGVFNFGLSLFYDGLSGRISRSLFGIL